MPLLAGDIGATAWQRLAAAMACSGEFPCVESRSGRDGQQLWSFDNVVAQTMRPVNCFISAGAAMECLKVVSRQVSLGKGDEQN